MPNLELPGIVCYGGESGFATLLVSERFFSAEFIPLTGDEPKLLDDFHFSETTEMIFQEESSDNRSLNSYDLDLDDYIIGKALSSPLFIQEREEPANRNEFGSLSSSVRENARRDSENERIRILLKRHKEQTVADFRVELQKHEFHADYDRRSMQKLNGVIESQRGD